MAGSVKNAAERILARAVAPFVAAFAKVRAAVRQVSARVRSFPAAVLRLARGAIAGVALGVLSVLASCEAAAAPQCRAVDAAVGAFVSAGNDALAACNGEPGDGLNHACDQIPAILGAGSRAIALHGAMRRSGATPPDADLIRYLTDLVARLRTLTPREQA